MTAFIGVVLFFVLSFGFYWEHHKLTLITPERVQEETTKVLKGLAQYTEAVALAQEAKELYVKNTLHLVAHIKKDGESNYQCLIRLRSESEQAKKDLKDICEKATEFLIASRYATGVGYQRVKLLDAINDAEQAMI